MGRNDVVLVLPKLSSYNSMQFEQKQEFEFKIDKYLEQIQLWGKEAVCFAEDFLAAKLFWQSTTIEWLCLLNESDLLFLRNNPDVDIPKEYDEIEAEKIPMEILKNTAKKYPAPRLSSFEDEESFRKARKEVIARRMRYAANEYLIKEAKFIIFIDAKNNYCNMPMMVVGDSKKVIHDNIVSGSRINYYGGIAVDLKIFETIIEKEACI